MHVGGAGGVWSRVQSRDLIDSLRRRTSHATFLGSNERKEALPTETGRLE